MKTIKLTIICGEEQDFAEKNRTVSVCSGPDILVGH
jgi:hypothetical protein